MSSGNPTPTETALARAGSVQTMVEGYRADYAQVLPSHIRPDTWLRVTMGALRRNPDLVAAAENDPPSLLRELLEAARLGLEPGTDEFYLVPFKDKERGKTVVGIQGYRGIIERMYRAGAVESVVAEVVHAADVFEFSPGLHRVPLHTVDWFAADRGPMVGVYAYAVMRGGTTSRVVVLGETEVERSKKASKGSSSASSPWNTNPRAMWLKTAVRRLEPWVPTSSEYREALRASRPLVVDTTTGEVTRNEDEETP